MISHMVGRDRRCAARRESDPAGVWRPLALAQAGVVGRRQLLDAGLTAGQVSALLDARRWVGLFPGVYATFTGPLTDEARLWAAVLVAGRGAALGGEAALALAGVPVPLPDVLTVCVPADRTPRSWPGVRVVRRRGLAHAVHPALAPPRLRVEQSLLDVTDAASRPTVVIDLVLRSTTSRCTTPARMLLALSGRPRHAHRALLTGLLGEAAGGVGSPLERLFLRTVERAHGLPRGTRNRQEQTVGRTGARRNRYRDIRYLGRRLVVETDGAEAHPRWAASLDRRRNNSVTLAQEDSLVYGWTEIVGDPCLVALEVAIALRQRGWRGTPTACGPACRLSGGLPP